MNDLLEKLDEAAKQLRAARLLLDRQYLDPFKRMDENEVKKTKEVRIYL